MSEHLPLKIKGKTIDAHTRCVHYHSQLDIIAIKMKCCSDYYPCISCHSEAVEHETKVWPKNEFDTKAIVCGACFKEMTITQYLASNYNCPFCNAAFNPKCNNHNHFYFEV